MSFGAPNSFLAAQIQHKIPIPGFQFVLTPRSRNMRHASVANPYVSLASPAPALSHVIRGFIDRPIERQLHQYRSMNLRVVLQPSSLELNVITNEVAQSDLNFG